MAVEILSIDVDKEEYERVMTQYTPEKVNSYLEGCFRALARSDLKGPGVMLKCPGCDHEWLYKGVEWRIRCNRCGTKILTGVKPHRNLETGQIEWHVEG